MIPRGQAGGYTLHYQKKRNVFIQKNICQIECRYFGGRAAEEIIFGKENITDGASSDIYKHLLIAKDIVTKYGMTEKFGPIFLDGNQEDYMFQRKYYSEQNRKRS